MTQQQGQGSSGQDHPAQGRPAILDQVSSTTFDDLEQQFSEQDRGEWDRFTQSFGWSKQQSDEVWNWFGQRATQDQKVPGMEGFPAEGPQLGNK